MAISLKYLRLCNIKKYFPEPKGIKYINNITKGIENKV